MSHTSIYWPQIACIYGRGTHLCRLVVELWTDADGRKMVGYIWMGHQPQPDGRFRLNITQPSFKNWAAHHRFLPEVYPGPLPGDGTTDTLI